MRYLSFIQIKKNQKMAARNHLAAIFNFIQHLKTFDCGLCHYWY